MKHLSRGLVVLFLLSLLLCTVFAAGDTLIPGGNTIGLTMETQGVDVVEFSSTLPEKAGLQKGDLITEIDHRSVSTTQEVQEAVGRSQGAPLTLTVSRKGQEHTVTMAPYQTSEGWRLGVYVRDSISGIGTVTYYDPDTKTFGALGHGISDGTTLLPLRRGSVLSSQVVAVTKGKCGAPGALQGAVCGRAVAGELLENTPQGVFGTMEPGTAQAMPVASASQVHTGSATIRSSVRGTRVEEFSVKICAVYPADSGDRNLLIQVTDPELLSLTGGIVQGMSGSPILQDGRIIGAVTHVLVDDPTRGYGIFIENMLAAA